MAPFASVLCAADATDVAPRVLRLGAAVVALSGAHLTVLTVTDGDRRNLGLGLGLGAWGLGLGAWDLGPGRLEALRC